MRLTLHVWRQPSREADGRFVRYDVDDKVVLAPNPDYFRGAPQNRGLGGLVRFKGEKGFPESQSGRPVDRVLGGGPVQDHRRDGA